MKVEIENKARITFPAGDARSGRNREIGERC